ncbi:hypothetical protein [Clostridium perfringens]|uniref:hypothetical protein n=1 Tax=Clostridium perfringens TaxID=1502 RepID=UPI0032DAE793
MDISNIKASQLATVINSELSKNKSISVNKVCEKLSLKPSSVKTKFKRAGYIYNSDERKYVEVFIPPQRVEELEPVENLADGCENGLNSTGGTNSTPKVEPLTETEIVAIRNLLNLEQYKDKFKISYKHSNDDIITRNIKMSKDLNTRFLQFVAKLPPHRLLDLYNTIFEEFLDKYE